MGAWRWTTSTGGADGLGMIEIAEVSGDPMANNPWKYSVMCLMTVAAFFKYVKSNLDAGRPDSSTLMFVKLVANFEMFRWAES